VAGYGIYAASVRSWKARWNASEEDAARSLPGDELVTAPAVVENRAVTISAPPSCVWAAVQEVIRADPDRRVTSVEVEGGRALVLHRRGVSWTIILQRLPGSRTRLLQRLRSARPLSPAARVGIFLA
jgi:hypothetical protein